MKQFHLRPRADNARFILPQRTLRGKSYKMSLRILEHQVNKKSQVPYLTIDDHLITTVRHPATTSNAQQSHARLKNFTLHTTPRKNRAERLWRTGLTVEETGN